MPHPIRRILIAVKGFDTGDLAAGKKVAQLARGLNAELCLFHALTGPLYLEVAALSKEPAAQAEQATLAEVKSHLEKMAVHLRSEGLKVTTAAAWDYPSHDAVIRAAQRLGADMVVVDCPRHSHTAPWFLHFTDWELLRKCPIPVLLIKNRELYRRAPILAALDPDHVGGKPATLDLDILDYGSSLASALDDHLHAVHAFNPIPDMPASEIVVPQRLAEAEDQAYAHAHDALDPLLDQVGISQNHRHIEEGFTVDVIENVVRATHAQILVMGAISRSGLKGLLTGNTAERMLDRLGCDMLIVKPADFRHLVNDTPRGVQLAPSPALAAAVAALS
jgi:universal stress protein E